MGGREGESCSTDAIFDGADILVNDVLMGEEDEDGSDADKGDDDGCSDIATWTTVPAKSARLLLLVGSETGVDGCKRGSLNEGF
jgi:hypothetical protein